MIYVARVPQEKVTDAIKVPKCRGVYIFGEIQTVPVCYTLDTGATRTIVSWKIFKQIPDEIKPKVLTNNKVDLTQANGALLENTGIVTLDITLGEQVFNKEVILADIKDDVLLGMDIGDTVDIITSEEIVRIDGKEIPCKHVKGKVRKVFALSEWIIPGNSECEIEVHYDQEGPGEEHQLEVILEPSNDFCERHKVIAARSLVKSHGCKILRVLNPMDTETVIRSNTTVGFIEEIEEKAEVICLI